MKSLRGLHLQLDPVSGIAGDMTVAALVDAGVPASVVSDAIAAIGVRGLRVRFEARTRGAYVGKGFVVEEPGSRNRSAGSRLKGTRGGVHRGQVHAGRAVAGKHEHGHERASPHEHEHEYGAGHGHERASAHEHEHEHGAGHGHERASAHEHEHEHGAGHGHEHAHGHHHRDYAEIRGLLARAKLDADAKALAQELFGRLAEVEAALHGSSIERVSFHELGAFDSIADIVGVAAAIAWLAPASIGSTPPVVGTGIVHTAHGVVPVPAPATAALLRGIPMVAEGPGELTTPTGALVLATVVDTFGPPPPMRIRAVGYGAGTRDVADRANVLRVLLGEPIGRSLPSAATDVLVLESNIDDMAGNMVAALFDALFAAGALDVWSTPIVMKKGRPAQLVSVLVEPSRLSAVERAFFLNSTTLGLRMFPMSRVTLARSTQDVRTPYGPVAVKIAGLDGASIGAEPEFEDCRRLASAAGVPTRRVWLAAVAAAAAAGLTSSLSPSRVTGERVSRRVASKRRRR